jgi:hypothetical protein
VLEIFACMDGPGIGFAENPVSFQLSGVFIAGAELALVARLSGARGYGWLVGLAASAAVVCAGVPQRLMEWSWARRCADGEAHACYAYAGVTRTVSASSTCGPASSETSVDATARSRWAQ